jgi:hypothetical protein
MSESRPFIARSEPGSVIDISQGRRTGSKVDVPMSGPSIVSTVSALLPLLPPPLALRHGPLMVTVESWSDGSVVARLPCAALYGSGDSDTAALEDLGSVIFDFVQSVAALIARKEVIGGPLKRDWENVVALVDIPA